MLANQNDMFKQKIDVSVLDKFLKHVKMKSDESHLAYVAKMLIFFKVAPDLHENVEIFSHVAKTLIFFKSNA